jgi:hypothetical protein
MLSLSPEPTQTLAGRTYYSDSILGTWPEPTGVYLSPGTYTDSGYVDMLIYLHGHVVTSIDQLFNGDGVAVRKQVLASGKKIVLAAPWLGLGPGKTYDVSNLKGIWGQSFIDNVLNALVPPKLPKPDLMHPQIGLIPQLRLRNLVIACHSAGGSGMRRLVGALGRYKANLVACWGFDCLYGVNDKDAKFWFNWSRGKDGRPLSISFGRSTDYESILLYLMKEGVATEHGARNVADGPTAEDIDIQIGIQTSKPFDEVMELDKLLQSTSPKPGQRQSQSSDFLDAAVANVRKHAGWPATRAASWEMHYEIARAGLLRQLKSATYL